MIINSKISKHWEFLDGLVNSVAWPKKKKKKNLKDCRERIPSTPHSLAPPVSASRPSPQARETPKGLLRFSDLLPEPVWTGSTIFYLSTKGFSPIADRRRCPGSGGYWLPLLLWKCHITLCLQISSKFHLHLGLLVISIYPSFQRRRK